MRKVDETPHGSAEVRGSLVFIVFNWPLEVTNRLDRSAYVSRENYGAMVFIRQPRRAYRAALVSSALCAASCSIVEGKGARESVTSLPSSSSNRAPTAAPTASETGLRDSLPSVREATFTSTGDGTWRIVVSGLRFRPGLRARVGTQLVVDLTIEDDGRRFHGVLTRAPERDDILSIGYGTRLVGTSVWYQKHRPPKMPLYQPPGGGGEAGGTR